ncbi:MAG: DNA polymerase/3'-5' exonuclease PolX [Candidatus Hodarchaeota archaeon]
MENKEVVKVLNEIADLLELQEVSFRPRAYRRAARSIEGLSESLQDIAARGELEKIPGIGKGIAKKLDELLNTGKLTYLDSLREGLPSDLVELLAIPGIGPKTAKLLRDKLSVQNIRQLQQALESHQLSNLPGFGERSEENIRHNLELFLQYKERFFIGKAAPIAQRIKTQLSRLSEVKQIEIAGSLRRWKETVGDIDILVASDDPLPIMQRFVSLPSVIQVLAQGITKSSVMLEDGIQVDIRVVELEAFGAALQYFTGSKTHNIELRRLALKHGWKLSEYGLFNQKTNQRIAGSSEEEIYKKLGLKWIPPELREDTGEIHAALRKQLPTLITLSDIQGDLHVHTKWSDGNDTIEAMATAAQKRGYKYLGICDHSKQIRIAHGLDEEKLREQIATIRTLNKRIRGLHLLAGIEVEILSDGSLDLTKEVLAETDLVVAALHYRTKASEEEMTDRLIQAMKNQFVDILAHPLGRIVAQRPAYEVNLDELCSAAKRYNITLEINALDRLDLPDTAARFAQEKDVKLAINSDAHQISQLDAMIYGVATARRGWVKSNSVINTLASDKLEKTLKHAH